MHIWKRENLLWNLIYNVNMCTMDIRDIWWTVQTWMNENSIFSKYKENDFSCHWRCNFIPWKIKILIFRILFKLHLVVMKSISFKLRFLWIIQVDIIMLLFTNLNDLLHEQYFLCALQTYINSITLFDAYCSPQ